MPFTAPYPAGASPEAQQINSIVQRMNARPLGPSPETIAHQQSLIDTAKADAARAYPPVPELGTADFETLTRHLMAPPQSVLTQDNELRQFGAEPEPQLSPHALALQQIVNEQNVAIPNLRAKGYSNVGDAPPVGIGSIGTSQGYMQVPSNRRPTVRDPNELRMLDAQNKAAEDDRGAFQKMTEFFTGKAPPPNPLSQREQMMIDALAKDEAERQAKKAAAYGTLENPGPIMQRAQMKQMGRDIRQEGPDAVAFAQLTQALKQQSQASGPPPAIMQLTNPAAYDRLNKAWLDQQQLGQGDARLDLLKKQVEQEAAGRTAAMGIDRERLGIERDKVKNEAALNERMFGPEGIIFSKIGRGQPLTPQERRIVDGWMKQFGGANQPTQNGAVTPPPSATGDIEEYITAGGTASNIDVFLDSIPEEVMASPEGKERVFEAIKEKFGPVAFDKWLKKQRETGPLYENFPGESRSTKVNQRRTKVGLQPAQIKVVPPWSDTWGPGG